MAVIPYHRMDDYLKNLKPFVGNSMSATLDSDGTYRVWSYNTLIAAIPARKGTIFVNERHYSITTSKHQSMVRAWLGYGNKRFVGVDGKRRMRYLYHHIDLAMRIREVARV